MWLSCKKTFPFEKWLSSTYLNFESRDFCYCSSYLRQEAKNIFYVCPSHRARCWDTISNTHNLKQDRSSSAYQALPPGGPFPCAPSWGWENQETGLSLLSTASGRPLLSWAQCEWRETDLTLPPVHRHQKATFYRWPAWAEKISRSAFTLGEFH